MDEAMLHGTYLCIMATDSLDFSWSQPNVSENRRASSFIFVKEAEDRSTPLLLSWLSACVWNSCKRSPRSATTCNPTAKQSFRRTQRDSCQATLSLYRQKLYKRAGKSYTSIVHKCNKHQELQVHQEKVLLCLTGKHKCTKQQVEKYMYIKRIKSWRWWPHQHHLLSLGLPNQAQEDYLPEFSEYQNADIAHKFGGSKDQFLRVRLGQKQVSGPISTFWFVGFFPPNTTRR